MSEQSYDWRETASTPGVDEVSESEEDKHKSEEEETTDIQAMSIPEDREETR